MLSNIDTKGQTVHWVAALSLEELWEGEMTDVEIEGEYVLLIHLPGEHIVAYQGVCPHQEQYLADGSYADGVLTCHAHEWQFKAETGEGINPAGCQLYRYEVKVEEGMIWVGFPANETRRYHRCVAE